LSDRVLYMEDDAAQARLVQKCLERCGCIVDLARDGAEGLAASETNSYDAIIVDQTMPGISGLEVIRIIAARGKAPPMVMVTGTGNERIAVEAMKLGVSDYLVKDLEGGFVNVLPLVVRRAIDQRRLLREKQRMERELAQAQRMQAIGQLAAGIAHEINTPTQYIGDNARFLQDAFADVGGLLDSFGQLLQAAQNDAITDEMLAEMQAKLRAADLGYLSREIPQAIQQSLEGLEHVASIVGAMKEFSHPGNGEKQPVDLNHVVSGAVTLCHSEWKYVATMVTDFDPDLPAVRCLPTDINSVVLNLVVNAAHAIAEATNDGATGKGAITIRTRLDGPYAEIRVEDTGLGIAEDIRSRVFDLFFTTKEVGRGTGQGLALTHAIVVDKHGGTIDFETEVGRGTTFIVRLPIDGQGRALPDDNGEQNGLVGATSVDAAVAMPLSDEGMQVQQPPQYGGSRVEEPTACRS
jgi:signal transduction histidine kinase